MRDVVAMSDPNTHLGPHPQQVTTVDGIEFLAELVALVAIGLLGQRLAPEPWSWVAAILLPLAAAALWGTFRAPKRLVPSAPIWVRTVTELVVMGAACWGLVVMGWWRIAVLQDVRTALSQELPQSALDAEQVTFLGNGWTTGLAHEAALKNREASQSWMESYPAMDYRHGPIAIAAPGRVSWMIGEEPEGLGAQVRASGADFVTLELDPLAILVVEQRLALERARARGLDPDTPRGLTRSVILDA